MTTINRILFPVDFSKMCARAATHVRAMAKRFNAEVVLFNVVEPPTNNWYAYGALSPVMVFMPPPPPEVSEEELKEWKHRKEERLANFLPELWGDLNVTRVIEEGYPAEAIINAVAERQIDLIMMPTHGDGRVRRFLLGSVTAKVLHDAPCPVWTDAHLNTADHAISVDLRKVICAVDMESQPAHLIANAREFATGAGAKLEIVHAVPNAEHLPGQPDDTFCRVILDDARKSVEKLVHRLGMPLTMHVQPGPIDRTVAEVAEREDADLVIIGREHADGMLGRLRGHGYAIVRESGCPVLSF